MPISIGDLIASLTIKENLVEKSREAASKFDQVSRRIESTGNRLSTTLNKSFTIPGGSLGSFAALTAVVYGLSKAVQSIGKEVIEGQKALSQLEAGVASTGRAAGYTADQLVSMSESLMKVSSEDDEVIQGGQAILLTYTKIRNQQFFSAMTDAMDVAARKGTDLASTATLIGKAYSGSIGGLAKAGIILEDSQKKQIQALFKSGRAVEAQIILHEQLQKSVGGSAAAIRDTLGGSISALQVRWGNLLQTVGQSGEGPFRVGIEGMVKLLEFLTDNWEVVESSVLQTLSEMTEFVADWADITAGSIEQVGRAMLWLADLNPFSDKKGLDWGRGLLDGIKDVRQSLHNVAEEFRIKAEEALDGVSKSANKTTGALGDLDLETGELSTTQSRLIDTTNDLSMSISDLGQLAKRFKLGVSREEIDTLKEAQKLTKQYLSDIDEFGERAAESLRALRIEESAARAEAERLEKIWNLVQNALDKHIEPIEITLSLTGPGGEEPVQWVIDQLQAIEDIQIANDQAFLEQREAAQVQLQEQANYFRDSLKFPREQLQDLQHQIDILAQACNDAGKPLLSAAEAEKLRFQAAEQFATQQLDAWVGFLSQLGDQLGGFFAQVAAAARSIQNVNSTAQSLGGWSSVAGAFGGVITAFVEIYKFADAAIKKQKSERFGTEATFNVMDGRSSSGFTSHAAMQVTQQIKDILKSIEDQLRISADDLASIGIRVSNDGKKVQAWVRDKWIGTFSDVNEAIRAALITALNDPSTSLRGMSDLMREGLKNWTSPNTEGLFDFLEALRQISDLNLSPLIINLQQAFFELENLSNAFGTSSQVMIDAHGDIIDSMSRLAEQSKNSMLGIDMAAADGIRNLVGFQAGIEGVSETFLRTIQQQIDAARARLQQIEKEAKKSGAIINAGGGRGGGRGEGGGSEQGGPGSLFLDAAVEINEEKVRLERAIREWTEKLSQVPKALSEQEIDLGIFTALEPFIRQLSQQAKGSAKYGEMIAKFERMRLDAVFAQVKLQLIAANAWERWAEVWQELYDYAISSLGTEITIPRRRGGSGGGTNRKELREELRDEIAGLRAEAAGPLHKAFFDLGSSIKDFVERCKEAKLPADETAAGVAELTKRFKEDMRARADLAAGIGTDFTRKLQDTVKLFAELRDLGREKTGIPDWLLKIREGQALGNLGNELRSMLDTFNGFTNPMIAITSQAEQLRQNVIAFAQAAGWSAEQLAAAMQQIRDGAEFQRQQAISGIMGRLFGYLKNDEKFKAQREAFELKMIDLDFRLMEAQLKALGAWDDATREIFSAAHAAARDLSDAADDISDAAANYPDPFPIVDYEQIISNAVQNFRQGVQSFTQSTQDLLTNEQLTALTQEQQEAAARERYNQLLQQANAGNLDAQALAAAREELLREISESQGGTGTSGYLAAFNQILAQSAQFLQNAQGIEQQVRQQALLDAMNSVNQGTQQITTAVYASAQFVANAIWEAIGVVPMMNRGGMVMRGAPLVRLHAPEVVIPLSRYNGPRRPRTNTANDLYRDLDERAGKRRLDRTGPSDNDRDSQRRMFRLAQDQKVMNRKMSEVMRKMEVSSKETASSNKNMEYLDRKRLRGGR